MSRARNIPERDTLLLPYQARWVRDRARLKLAEKSRQIGWTWATAYELVSRKALATARLDGWISSRDDIQARLFLEDCKSFAQLLDIAAQDLGERVIDDKGHSAYVLSLANGLRLHSMSSNPDAQAGKRGDRVLDEFALHPDPRKLYNIAFPGITWGGAMSIFSTHRGSQNFFNELVREVRERGNPKGISLHRVTLQDALDQGFLFKLQQKLPPDDPRMEMDEAAYFDFTRAGCADEESFQQEFMCNPADDEGAFLTYDMIAGCEYEAGEAWIWDMTRLAEADAYCGIDIGRVNDLTSLRVLVREGNAMWTRHDLDLQGMRFSEQEALVYPVIAACKRTCIDQTGIGRQFAERAQERFGTYKVEGVNFTGGTKEEMAYPLRAAFEDKSIRIPFDRDTRADLRGVRKMTTSSGNIRFAGERGKNGHCDRFWALALALHAGKRTGGPLQFAGVDIAGRYRISRGVLL